MCMHVVYLRVMTTRTTPEKDGVIVLRIDAKFKARIVKEATKRKQTISDLIRTAVEKEISSNT